MHILAGQTVSILSEMAMLMSISLYICDDIEAVIYFFLQASKPLFHLHP